MENNEAIIKNIAFRTFISVFFCALFGYIFWGRLVFYRYHTAFLYIVVGTIGSIFFYTLRVSLRNALASLLVVSLLFSIIIMRSWGLYFLRNFLVICTSAFILYLYFKIMYGQSHWQRLLEPLVLALLFAVGNLLAFVTLVFIGGGRIFISFIWAFGVMEQYFLIGLGIGIGIILTEEPYSKIIYHRILSFLQ